MYQPIPGFAHLKRFIPQDRVTYSREPEKPDSAALNEASSLVRVAIEVAAGQRPVTHLTARYFHPTIKLHLSMWTRGAGLLGKKATCGLVSLHVRTTGECYGTAEISGKHHAYTGTIKDGIMKAFRLL